MKIKSLEGFLDSVVISAIKQMSSKTKRQTSRHRASPTQVDVSTHLFAHVNTAGHDSFDRQLVNSRMVLSPDRWLKQSLCTAVSG